MSSVCISVCIYVYTLYICVYTYIYTYIWVKFVWCSLPQACRILHRKEMGGTGLASEPAPTSELCASSLRHPRNEICWLTQWKQKLAFFSRSWLRVFLPAGQGVRVLKFWNLFLFPSGTNKPKEKVRIASGSLHSRRKSGGLSVVILSRELMLHVLHPRWISVCCWLLQKRIDVFDCVVLFLSEIL